jgi:hypothetical protein
MYYSNTIGFIVLSSRFLCIYHVDCWMKKKFKTISALLHSLNVLRMYRVERSRTSVIYFFSFNFIHNCYIQWPSHTDEYGKRMKVHSCDVIGILCVSREKPTISNYAFYANCMFGNESQ